MAFDSAITFLKTRDLEATTAFYRDLLNCPLWLDQGRCRIFRLRAGAFLGFCQQHDAPVTEQVILTLVLDDVDGLHGRLRDAGVTVEVAPRHNPDFRIYQCFVRDPMGYLVELQRFEDSRWRHE